MRAENWGRMSERPHAPAIEPAHDILRAGGGVKGLHAVFAPRTVALIGATERPATVGRAILTNLTSGAFAGAVYPVNPRHTSVLGHECYASIAAAPQRVDLAVIVTPALTVPDVVLECGRAGVRAAIVISAGFREIGADGIELERRVLDNARASGMRIVGPNCLGVMTPRLGFNATFANTTALAGGIGFVSQSGALCTAILDWSLSESVGFSHFASLGSMADVGWGDVIDYLGDDPHTHAIILYMESIGDAGAFMSAAREVAMSKPVIVIKGGRTTAAAHAAASHTGALVGSDDVADAAFRRCGVLRVESLSDLFYMAEALAKQPRAPGKRLAIITNAGGAGVLATDTLVLGGGELAPLEATSIAGLDAAMPAHWSRGNPVDVLGDATPERYEKALAICEQDANVDGLLVVLAPQGVASAEDVARAIAPLGALPGKPVIAAWMGGEGVAAGAALLKKAGIPTYLYPDTASRVFNYMWRYDDALKGLYETPVLADGTTPDRTAVHELIACASAAGRTLLTEYESKRLLAAYGIPTADTRLALTPDDAVAAAAQIGFPVAVKLHSLTVTHKSDVGGVVLNVLDAASVRAAFSAIDKSARERAGPDAFIGVTVQPMVEREGYELIVGASADAQFGPVLLFGLGGTLVDVFRDRALALPPLTTTLARRMMERTKIYQALKGVRGRASIDLAALEQILVRFGELAIEQPRIKEVEINPLFASPSGLLSLDARAILHDPAIPDAALPRSAIRAYPARYAGTWTARDGREFQIRPIRPEDEPQVAKFHERLSQTTVYMRYATAMRLSDRVRHERLSRVCFIDYNREIALVAIETDPALGHRIVAIGRLIREHAADEAEFAMTVEDDRQKVGIGSELLRRLVDIARHENIGSVVGYILADNTSMLRVCQRLGFVVMPSSDDKMITVRIATGQKA